MSKFFSLRIQSRCALNIWALRDPDGHKNEMIIETMPMGLADEWIHSPEFAANPIG
jgi:hypothetical protein